MQKPTEALCQALAQTYQVRGSECGSELVVSKAPQVSDSNMQPGLSPTGLVLH